MLMCEGRCEKFFHVWCVGLGAVPKGRWMCNACSSAPTLNKGGRLRKTKQTVSSKRSEEDLQALRQWKMAMGICGT
jgi:hypothetical protein